MSFIGYRVFNLIAAGAVGYTQCGIKMQTSSINLAIFHISKDCLLQKLRRDKLRELLLAEIAGEQFLCTLIDADVHDIVIVDILYFKAIIIIGSLDHLVLGRIDGNIPVIPVAVEK